MPNPRMPPPGPDPRPLESSRGYGEQGWSPAQEGYDPPKALHRTDAQIEEDISRQLEDDDRLDPREIEVRVEQGVVTLTGSVPERAMKHLAREIADHTRGVVDVHSDLQVIRTKNR